MNGIDAMAASGPHATLVRATRSPKGLGVSPVNFEVRSSGVAASSALSTARQRAPFSIRTHHLRRIKVDPVLGGSPLVLFIVVFVSSSAIYFCALAKLGRVQWWPCIMRIGNSREAARMQACTLLGHQHRQDFGTDGLDQSSRSPGMRSVPHYSQRIRER